jgi:ATP-dependent Clp protease protease subunit
MTQLQKLLMANRQVPRPQRPVSSSVVLSGEEATIYIYDAIVSDEATAQWWGGVSAEALVPQIRAIKGGIIHLRINSPGGDVFAAQAISHAIRETGAKVIAHIDGYAASAATVVATAADDVEMSEGGFYMIHKSWTFAIGNEDDLIKTAGLLKKVDGVAAQQYAAKSGADLQQILDWMLAETWFTAQEAVDAGLVNRVAASPKVEASWDLSAYSKAPKVVPAANDENLISQEHRDRQMQRMQMMTRLQIG